MRTFHGVTLSWTVDEAVLEVKLHRGPCNEIGTAMLHELEQLAALVDDGAAGARAMLIYSDRPKGFSAGADLRELHDGMKGLRSSSARTLAQVLVRRAGAEEPVLATVRDMALGAARVGRRALVQPLVVREVRRFLRRIHAVFDVLDSAPIVTVAACHGVVFGGGFELALTADVRVADASARFAFPELRLGIVPGFGGVPRLEREVGNGVVRDLLLTGRSLNARRAHTLGLVSQVTARGEHVQAARRAARQAARFDPASVAAAKRFVKPVPRARLDAEIDTFLEMLRNPAVEAALERFVTSTDVRPYLP
ncbi:MAG: enoyl-CoA hydratase/isomerase family protein [Alphaproteobacteria bacterium]|nr:enoyl-CoA hydratase/isomerase family protein [Alphaproteobacteria bacterium]